MDTDEKEIKFTTSPYDKGSVRTDSQNRLSYFDSRFICNLSAILIIVLACMGGLFCGNFVFDLEFKLNGRPGGYQDISSQSPIKFWQNNQISAIQAFLKKYGQNPVFIGDDKNLQSTDILTLEGKKFPVLVTVKKTYETSKDNQCKDKYQSQYLLPNYCQYPVNMSHLIHHNYPETPGKQWPVEKMFKFTYSFDKISLQQDIQYLCYPYETTLIFEVTAQSRGLRKSDYVYNPNKELRTYYVKQCLDNIEKVGYTYTGLLLSEPGDFKHPKPYLLMYVTEIKNPNGGVEYSHAQFETIFKKTVFEKYSVSDFCKKLAYVSLIIYLFVMVIARKHPIPYKVTTGIIVFVMVMLAMDFPALLISKLTLNGFL